MGGAGGGAEALCAVLFTGLPFCIQNLSSQITQPREPPPLDSAEKLPRDWGLWPRVSGFLVMRPNQEQGEKIRPQTLNNQLRFEVGKKVL